MANILLIDDSQSALTATGQILTGAGHRVIPCLSAKEAMSVAARDRVDLIVTDIYMPEMDGLEVIAQARRVCPGVPVIAVSSFTGAKDMLRTAKLLGARCTLQKPFPDQKLLQAVSQAMAATGLSSQEEKRG